MTLAFPPLLSGHAAADDAFQRACFEARNGCDGGLVTYRLTTDPLGFALVFAPDVPLKDAMAMMPLCAVGLQNAIGALAPPEVAIQFDWDGGIRLNGGLCGALRVAASSRDAEAVPDWLVVGVSLHILPDSDAPGETPDRTSLFAEGCSEIALDHLIESWARHTLVSINRWSEDGPRALHHEWTGLAHGIDSEIVTQGERGTFIGTDDRFGLLLRKGDETVLIPLTSLLETP